MAIYLDTNIVCRWRSFGELERLALSIAAAQLGQEICLPELVVAEATARRQRELSALAERFEDAAAELVAAFDLEYAQAEPRPDPTARALRWRRHLEELGRVVPSDPADALAALEREIRGIPPARERSGGAKGAGARDAAIWLAIVADHADRDEPGHFLTKDARDFLQDDGLKPRLREDLSGHAHPLRVHRGIAALLEDLGTSETEVSIDAETLTERGLPAVVRGLRESPAVPRVVFDTIGGYDFRTIVENGEVTKVNRARRYARPGIAVTMVDAEWNLRVDLRFRELGNPDSRIWSSFPDVELRGRLQVYLPEPDQDPAAAELIAAQLTSDVLVSGSFGDDGLLVSRRALDLG